MYSRNDGRARPKRGGTGWAEGGSSQAASPARSGDPKEVISGDSRGFYDVAGPHGSRRRPAVTVAFTLEDGSEIQFDADASAGDGQITRACYGRTWPKKRSVRSIR